MNHLDTQRLTRASLELRSGRSIWRRAGRYLTLALLPMLAVTGGLYLRDVGAMPFARFQPTTDLAAENSLLRAELERVRIELKLDRATRDELKRQARVLNDEINELRNRVEFLSARASSATSR